MILQESACTNHLATRFLWKLNKHCNIPCYIRAFSVLRHETRGKCNRLPIAFRNLLHIKHSTGSVPQRLSIS